MDAGLLFTFGVACGLLGTACFVWLLLLSDPDACAYISLRLDRLGVQRSRAKSQGTVNAAVVPHLCPSGSITGEQPGGGSNPPAGHFLRGAKHGR